MVLHATSSSNELLKLVKFISRRGTMNHRFLKSIVLQYCSILSVERNGPANRHSVVACFAINLRAYARAYSRTRSSNALERRSMPMETHSQPTVRPDEKRDACILPLSSSRFVRSPGVNTACINRVPSGTGCKRLSLPRTVAGDYINFNYRANVASRRLLRFRSAVCYCGTTRKKKKKKKRKKEKIRIGTPCRVSRFCVSHATPLRG